MIINRYRCTYDVLVILEHYIIYKYTILQAVNVRLKSSSIYFDPMHPLLRQTNWYTNELSVSYLSYRNSEVTSGNQATIVVSMCCRTEPPPVNNITIRCEQVYSVLRRINSVKTYHELFSGMWWDPYTLQHVNRGMGGIVGRQLHPKRSNSLNVLNV